MPVKAADPDAAPLDAAFAAAMGAAPKPKEPAAPPEIDPDAPHGRDDQGEPLAPYGLTKDGKVRRSAAGRRPAADDKPRTAPAAAAPAASDGKPAAAPKDYSGTLAETADGVWLCLTAAGQFGPRLPLLGKHLPGPKLAASAFVVHESRPRLVAAMALAAEHNTKARLWCERLDTGNATWLLAFAALALPVAGAMAAVWQGDGELKKREMLPLAEMAGKNETLLDEYMASLGQQLGQAAGDISAVAGEPGKAASDDNA